MLAVLALGGAACFGAVPRAEFEQELRARGGGLVDELGLDAVELVRRELGGRFDVRSVVITPLQAQVQLNVVVGPSGETDTWLVRAGEVVDVQPVRLSAGAEALAPVNVVALPLDRLEELGDWAMAELGFEDPWIQKVVLWPDGVGGLAVVYSVESPRAFGTVTFDGNGGLVDAARQ